MSDFFEKTIKIANHAGIHCRPSSIIIQAVNSAPDHSFILIKDGIETELNSILGLISLGLQKGTEITVRVIGPDAQQQCEKISQLFAKKFDFPPRV